MAEYLSGVCIALLFAAPLLLRLSMAGLWTNVLLILVGAVFTVSMAFFLGFWTKGPKTFEVIYLLLWYVGPFQKTRYLDFTGAASGIEPGPFVLSYTILSLMMLCSVALARPIGRALFN